MKKRILIAIAVLALFVLVFASCGGSSCEHEWELKSTTATCTEAGEGTYVCSLCQAEEVREQSALDHDYPSEPNEIKVPNCKEGGYSLYVCQREGCGHEEKKHETKPNPTAHDYEDVYEAPTCTAPGYTDRICKVEGCGQGDGSYAVIPALGHTFTREEPTGITVVEPKCKVDGYVTYKCQDCDLAEITRTIADLLAEGSSEEDKALANTLYALEHEFTVIANPDTDIVLPTCLTPGYTVYTCANGCGQTQSTAGTDAEVAALGHTYNRVGGTINLVVSYDSTCIQTGLKVAQCEDCEHKATSEEITANANLMEVIPTVDHFTGKGGDAFEKVGDIHPATCTESTYWDVKCALDENCTEMSTRKCADEDTYVDALDHEWYLYTDVLTSDAPTCLTEGEYRYLCTRCDVYMVDAETPAKNGIGGSDLKEAGYTVDKDGVALKDDLAAELVLHQYTVGEYVKAPTCVSRGIYACSVCQRNDIVSYEDDVDYDYHNREQIKLIKENIIEVIPPTCHTPGYSIYTCDHDSKCTETLKVEDVAMLNHTFAPVTEDGVLVCTVAECGAMYRNITSNTEITTEDFCLCGNCGDKVECGGTVSSMGTTIPTAPQAIVNGEKIALDKNIGKGIIELNAVAGTTFEVKVFNGENEVETLVVLNVTADENGKAYIFLYDVETVTSVSITASASATVSFYGVKEVF